MKRALASLSLAIALAVLATACGGGGGTKPTPTPTRRATTATATPRASTPTPTPSAGGDAARGKQVSEAKGCLACHTTDGSTLLGPTWKGLYGKSETLEGGATVTVNDAYIAESTKTPGATIVKGFPNIMPALALTDDEIKAVTAYIQSLK